MMEDRLDFDAPRAALIYAAMSVAHNDSMVACWDAKYTYWAIRPCQVDPDVNTTSRRTCHRLGLWSWGTSSLSCTTARRTVSGPSGAARVGFGFSWMGRLCGRGTRQNGVGKAWISLDSLVSNEPFQWVMTLQLMQSLLWTFP